jgi:hypothetical protein
MVEKNFAEEVLARVPAQPPVFPQVNYDPDGDCIEFLVSDESFYAKRIDALTTIYYGQESNGVVGALITGVRKFLAQVVTRSPGFRVDIQDGRVRLEYLFTAKLWAQSGDPGVPEVFVYRILRDKAAETKAEVELGDAVPV